MLHKESIAPETLDLIVKLQADPELRGFLLAGGTALSLMIGHRLSLDIDLFNTEDFNTIQMLEHLEKSYGFSMQFIHKNTLKGIIDGVFVDLITHSYPFVKPPVASENITFLSKEDIAAMKLNAIAGIGTRPKDFIDIYFLLKEYSLKQLVGFYSKKYSERNTFHVVKSLTWFDDMDVNAWPMMIREKDLSPVSLRKRLEEISKNYLQ